jgi:hypothetical protein
VKTHYLVDYDYLMDDATGFASMGHLLAFCPGPREASLDVTIFFEDREPEGLTLSVPAGRKVESNYESWPVRPDSRFALRVVSSEPVVCQATVGWNVTRNDYSLNAPTTSPLGVRECAKSYMSLTQLSTDWYSADGLVIDVPTSAYIRESEWAIALNPGETPAEVAIHQHYQDGVASHRLTLPPRRLRWVLMDDVARHNAHYGVHFESDRPIAAQWQRLVRWNDERELMAYWSAPCVPGPLAG